MFAAHTIRNAVSFLTNRTVLAQRLVSGVAATKEMNGKHLQETALAENCILVDEFDQAIGQSTKRDCHRLDESGRIKLHRAFSVFLFNSMGDMLIQRRSAHKVRTTSCVFAQEILDFSERHSGFWERHFGFIERWNFCRFLILYRSHFPIVIRMHAAVIRCTISNVNETKSMKWAFERLPSGA